MDRRDAIRWLGAAGGAAALGPSMFGRALAAKGARDRMIVDGNLVAPLDPSAALDKATTTQVRLSGLTAFKQTLGGGGNQSKTETETEIADIDKAIGLNRTVFTKIRTLADLADAQKSRRVGIIYSFEAAEMLEGQIDNIDHFRRADVLVMGLSYNRVTPFASGVMAPQSTGLTPLGRQAVARMNAIGITVDLSHSDERSSLGALQATSRPVLISHAGCNAIHPHPRNKSDALLRAMAAGGGVIGIYELAFLVPPPRQPVLADYIAHLTHALNVCGEDHVGIGTDGLLTPFDISPESMKAWDADIARRKAAGISGPGEGPPPFVIGLNRPDRYQVIGDALRRRGYSRHAVDKVLGGNLLRVFRETWGTA